MFFWNLKDELIKEGNKKTQQKEMEERERKREQQTHPCGSGRAVHTKKEERENGRERMEERENGKECIRHTRAAAGV